ncbi:MAG: ATP-dependent sacrificial sulfur transferase LarE [Proteobacteria bacterium]|nr:ATP-dependent sacrificial sulfur transferase LarE [Pseudomonadota bacterium]
MNIEQKLNNLKEIIKGIQKVVVAFSGGVDSTFLLKICIDILGRENVIAFIGLSPACPQSEIEEAKSLSKIIGAECIIEETSEMEDRNFIQNTTSRCYFCKTHLFNKAWEIAKDRGFLHVAEGSNLDDLDDFRPGRKACIEQHILSPLLTAELTKNEIRELSKKYSLPTHNKPSLACLSSRIPYGTPISIEVLKRIERSENFIRSLGIRQVRVRHHGNIARIEVTGEDFGTIMANKTGIVEALKQYGFSYVTLDLEGYKTGSMNIVI